jgi:hypothetical protein
MVASTKPARRTRAVADAARNKAGDGDLTPPDGLYRAPVAFVIPGLDVLVDALRAA